MKIVRGALFGAAVTATALVSIASPSAATPIPCPDGMTSMNVLLVPQGQQKDKNNNGLVCGKLGADGT